MNSPTNDVLGETDHNTAVDSLEDKCRHKEVEKELPTWDLENIFGGPWDRGWVQFQTNETLFGKNSNFNEVLYTTKFGRGPEIPSPKSGVQLETDEDVVVGSFVSMCRQTEEKKELAIDKVQPDEDIPQISELENILCGVWNRGWDQFEINEALFGVKSKFNDQLYTSKLVRGPEIRHLEKKAMRREREICSKEIQGLPLEKERGIDAGENLDIDEETQVSSVPGDKSLDKNQSGADEDIPLDSRNTEFSGRSDDGPRTHSTSSPVESGIDTHEIFDIEKETQAASVSQGKLVGISGCLQEDDIHLDSRNAETVGSYDSSSRRSTQWSRGKSNDGAKISPCSFPLKRGIGHGKFDSQETQFSCVSRGKSLLVNTLAGGYGSSLEKRGIGHGKFDSQETQFSCVSRGKSLLVNTLAGGYGSSLEKRGIGHGKFDSQETQFSCVSRGKLLLGNTLAGGYGSSLEKRGIGHGKFDSQETQFSCVSRGKSLLVNTSADGYGTNSRRSIPLSGGKINNAAKIASGSSSVGSLSSLNFKNDSSDKGDLLSNVTVPTYASVLSKNEGETNSKPLIEAPPSKASHGEPEVLKTIAVSDPPASYGASSLAAIGAASSDRSTLNPDAQVFELNPNANSSTPSASPVSASASCFPTDTSAEPHTLEIVRGIEGSLSSLNFKNDSSDKGDILSNVTVPTYASVLSKNEGETNSKPLIEAPPTKASHGEPEVLKTVAVSDPPASSGASSSAAIGAASSERFTLNPDAQVFELNPNANSSTPSESPASAATSCFPTDMSAASRTLEMARGTGSAQPFAWNQSVVFPREFPQMQPPPPMFNPLYSHAMAQQMQFSPQPYQQMQFSPQPYYPPLEFQQMQFSPQPYYPPLQFQEMQLSPQPYYPPLQFQQMQPRPQVYQSPPQVPQMQHPPQEYVPVQDYQIIPGHNYPSTSSTGPQPGQMYSVTGLQPPLPPPCPPQPAPPYYRNG